MMCIYNALIPMNQTELGIITDFKDEQNEKA